MTHIYSRGCFKLIFRKCLPIHTFYPPQAASTRRHTYTYVLYRDCPPSRAFASSRERSYNISATLAPSSLRSVFRTLIPFSFLRFPPFFSLPSLSFCFSRLNFSFLYFLSLSILCSSLCFFFFQLHFYNFSKFFKFYFCFYVFSFLHFLSCISSHFFLYKFFIPYSLLSLLFNFIFLLFSFFLFLYFNIAFFIFSSPSFSH